MKKILLFLFLILLPINIKANEKIEVTLDKCVDGDTAWVILNNERIKLRFLAIDTPESTTEIEPYGKEASILTCNYLTTSKIEIEYDSNSNKFDKYNRHLVWVFVNDKLLQDIIIKEGLAEIKYIYGDYKYLDTLNNSLKSAKENELNIWSKEYLFVIFNYKVTKETLYFILTIIILTLLYIFNKKSRKKINKKISGFFK